MKPTLSQFRRFGPNDNYCFRRPVHNDKDRSLVANISPGFEKGFVYIHVTHIQKEIVSNWAFQLMSISSAFCLHSFRFNKEPVDRQGRELMIDAHCVLVIPLDAIPFDRVIESISTFHAEGYWEYAYSGFP